MIPPGVVRVARFAENTLQYGIEQWSRGRAPGPPGPDSRVIAPDQRAPMRATTWAMSARSGGGAVLSPARTWWIPWGETTRMS
jgi:hypothetical protein